MSPLPIDPLLPEVLASLERASRLVLRAPPGAGKTTRVPAAILDRGIAGDRSVMVLEPRRIAARAAADFVAAERVQAAADQVGYRVRFEQRGGAGTRLWFVTEGTLTRGLRRDPYLEEAGVVVLDEFHERHVDGDVALGVVRELQETVRPDLKLVVMSATLDTERLARFLGDCPVLTSEGRRFPVEIEYEERQTTERLAGRVAAALARALGRPDEGDILVFLPGAAEIRRTASAIEPLAAANDLAVVPLHGDLPLDTQRTAIRRGPRRKVVLSTNVAETALTIEGVSTVIDSGLAREARFDPRHGLNAIRLVAITRDSADQRAGRAGRTGPGRCFRLWTRAEHADRRERAISEILRLDLAATVLELRAWGARDVRGFPWLDPPGEAALRRAEDLLEQLGAVDGRGVTDTGRRMLALAVHPRLSRILVEAERFGVGESGALLAALASERDVCVEGRAFGDPAAGCFAAGASDLALRMELFAEARARGFDSRACRELGLDARTVRAVERARRQLARAVGAPRPTSAARDDALLRATLAGFPDRVCRRRQKGSPRAVMVGRTGVALDPRSAVREADLFLAVEVEAGGAGPEARVRIASEVRREWLEETFPGSTRRSSELVFDWERERVVERARVLYQDLVLEESIRTDVDPVAAGEILREAARENPGCVVALDPEEISLLARIRFLAERMPDLGLPSDGRELLSAAVDRLCAGRRSFEEIRRADLDATLRSLLSRRHLLALGREAPERWRLPSGRLAPVRYQRGRPPSIAARIQELFGLRATPRFAAGRAPVVIELLAPSRRPVQVTDDIDSFWRNAYPEVRKQLRGRYPKHAWPEDPLRAVPKAAR